MSKPILKFYIDLHSPYAYLAYAYIRNSAIFKSCDTIYIPVLLVGFVKAGVSLPPWKSPNKVDYLQKDVSRWAKQMSIPWQPGWPANYPNTKTSDVQRAVTACSVKYPERVVDLLDALYYAFWAEHKGVQLAEVYEPILIDVLGEKVACSVIQYSTSDAVRDLLRSNTKDAIASGAPGLPWFVAINSAGESDCFWGFDHLGQVARFLGLGSIAMPHL